MAGWITCERCNRVLRAEHGPVCGNCRSDLDSGDDDEVNLWQMTKDELAEYGQSMGLTLDAGESQADLIASIESANAEF